MVGGHVILPANVSQRSEALQRSNFVCLSRLADGCFWSPDFGRPACFTA